LVKSFEENFERIYARAAKSPEHGYFITRAILTAIIPTMKPVLRVEELGEKEPPGKAYKGEREIYWNWKWHKATLWEMDLLKPGNLLEGPCIVEHPATTFLVPPGYRAFLDPRRIFWLIPPGKEIPKEAMRVR
jgi:N-methylhydantoinase A/oxoprolinase/acetone carboxylase beta subunit